MKKKILTFLCLLGAAALLGGCGEEETRLSAMKTEKYVTLGEYKNLEVSVPAPVEVTDDYRQNYIDYVLSRHAQWEEVTDGRTAQLGDLVNIDYVGKRDGVAFDGGSDTGFDLELGSGSFISGFEDGLVGVAAGETKDLDLTFPDPYPNNPDLAGAPVVFTVTVNSISEKKTPELTDDFVKTLDAGCDTVAEYETYVTELLEKDAQDTYENNLETALLDKAMENCTFKEPPKAMVDQYYDRSVRNLTKLAASAGMSLETLVTGYYGTSMEEFETQAREGATQSCKEALMLQAIANKEGITVSQEEIDDALQEAVENGGYADVDSLKTELGEDNYEDYVMCDKVLALLKESAVVTKQ